MRFKFNKLKNKLGETRIIEKFLWFPIVIDDELRWLQKAKIIKKVYEIEDGGSMEWGKYKYKWRNEGWID